MGRDPGWLAGTGKAVSGKRALNHKKQVIKETEMSHRMRFGIFLAPFHKPGINPTLALEQDLELIQDIGAARRQQEASSRV
jgi:hypothetical protein